MKVKIEGEKRPWNRPPQSFGRNTQPQWPAVDINSHTSSLVFLEFIYTNQARTCSKTTTSLPLFSFSLKGHSTLRDDVGHQKDYPGHQVLVCRRRRQGESRPPPQQR